MTPRASSQRGASDRAICGAALVAKSSAMMAPSARPPGQHPVAWRLRAPACPSCYTAKNGSALRRRRRVQHHDETRQEKSTAIKRGIPLDGDAVLLTVPVGHVIRWSVKGAQVDREGNAFRARCRDARVARASWFLVPALRGSRWETRLCFAQADLRRRVGIARELRCRA